MIRPFFHSKERQELLEREARTWLGTPYFAHAASKGHGVGCVNLIQELWIAAGAIARFALPAYQIDYAHHSTQTQLLRFLMDHEALRGRLLFVPVNTKRRVPGDLFGLRSGNLDHHLACAIMWGKVIHAVDEHGVIVQDETDEKFSDRVLYSLRLMETA